MERANCHASTVPSQRIKVRFSCIPKQFERAIICRPCETREPKWLASLRHTVTSGTLSRSEWDKLLFQSSGEELDDQQCQLVVTLIEAMLCDYSAPLPEGKDFCSQTVAAFIREETKILKKQLQLYAR